MPSPLDKQQEHKISPVECQQEQLFIRRVGRQNVPDFFSRLMAAKSPGGRIPIDGHSKGVAAYACHKPFNPQKFEVISSQGADHR
jgi:hypothetical protein